MMKIFVRKGAIGLLVASFLFYFPLLARAQGTPSNDYLRARTVSLGVLGYQFGGGVLRNSQGKFTGNGLEVQPIKWSGSGFLVGKDGTIVTNYHVASKAMRAIAQFDQGGRYDIHHIKVYDSINDLAVLKIGGGGNFPTARLGNSDLVEPRDDVIAVGNPMGAGLNITDGRISQVVRDIDGNIVVLRHTAPIAPGNSGGPLFKGVIT